VTTSASIRAPRLSALAVVGMIALGGLAVAGCGGDDDSDTTGTTGASATTSTTGAKSGGGGSSTIQLSETDFALNPPNPTVKAGEVTINATNDGAVPHNIEVEGPGEEQELESDLAPGDSGTLTVDLSEPGTYEWYCPVGNHRDMGMEGEITVK
jgi:plastocyanin